MDTKPQLEIFADDVKCAHGATVGQLDADEVFYLKSRGLSDAMARSLLTYAFGAEILRGITVVSLRQRLEQVVPPVSDVQHTHQYLEGLPVDEIVKFAQREEIDLIVMASHGRRGVSRLLLGSQAHGRAGVDDGGHAARRAALRRPASAGPLPIRPYPKRGGCP